MSSTSGNNNAYTEDNAFLGHPRGLSTLFFTEMWERFSYYGMRAILVLFMVATVERGGMGLDDVSATAIYGLYTMFVYLLALPGGWLADNIFGQRKAIWYGGIIIAAGHFSMALPFTESFFFGLVLIVLGTGLLKPSISTIVGGLYPENESARRDAGFSIFYMGINLGAFLAPLIVGYLGEVIDWHLGFGMAGFGMVLGLIQYKLTESRLQQVGVVPNAEHTPEFIKKVKMGLVVAAVALALFVGAIMAGLIAINPLAIAEASAYVILSMVSLFFAYVIFFGGLDAAEIKKVIVIAFLFLFAAMFWSGFEQAGSSLNLFAERYTDRNFFGWLMPTSWFQSINAIFIIILAPVFGWLWVALANAKRELSMPFKFGLGLVQLGLGFFVLVFAANIALANEAGAGPGWLVLTYLLHTMGELCLSPVGLSSITKLSPKKFVGQMMGIWFMATALGNLIAGLVAGRFSDEAITANPSLLPDQFMLIFYFTAGAGLVMIVLSPFIKKLMGNVK
jgi:POT family proton-dependent oligopeptide transporter